MGKKASKDKSEELPANLRKMRERIRKVLANKRLTEVQAKLEIGMILQPLMEQMVVHGKRDAFDRLANALGNGQQELIDCAMMALGTMDPEIRKAVKNGASWTQLQEMLEEMCMGGLQSKCDNYYEQLGTTIKGLSEEDLRTRLANKCCRKCYVMPGELHIYGCSNEQCPDCGRQLLSCECHWNHSETQVANRLPWTGEWPGVAECIEFG